MATKSHSLLMILVLMAAANCATALGGWKSLAVEEPAAAPVEDEAFVTLDAKASEVVEIAKFAVDEYNKQNKGRLNFECVFAAAYTHGSGGVNYGLVITVNDGEGLQAYNANVLVDINGAKRLLHLWKKRVI